MPSWLLPLEQGCDFWSNLGDDILAPAHVKEAKQLLVTLILATDMANHGADLTALKGKVENDGNSSGKWALQTGDDHKADRTLALKVKKEEMLAHTITPTVCILFLAVALDY